MHAFKNLIIDRQNVLVHAIRNISRDVNFLPLPQQLKLLKKIRGSFAEMKAQVSSERAAYAFQMLLGRLQGGEKCGYQ